MLGADARVRETLARHGLSTRLRVVDGGHAIECETIEAARELNLAGRETIRRMTETIYSDLYADREAGKHNLTSEQMRLRAHEKAKRLVAETAPKVKSRPLR